MGMPLNVLTVSLVYGPDQTGRACRSRLYYFPATGEITENNITAIADSFNAIFQPLMRAVLTQDWRWYGTELKWRGVQVEMEGRSTDAGGLGAITDSDYLPIESAVVIRRRTGKPGRSKRGRIFISGVPEKWTEGEQLLAAGQTAYLAIANKIDQQIPAGGGSVMLNPLTIDFKNTLTTAVTNSEILTTICSRRDRRLAKKPVVIGSFGV